MSRVTLSRYLIEQTRSNNTPADLRFLIEVVARACKEISHAVSKGALGGVLGSMGTENVQGEVQKKLDVLSNEILLEANEWGGHLAGMASEEMDNAYQIPGKYPKGAYLLVFDPLDGSSNIDINAPVGTIVNPVLPARPVMAARARTVKPMPVSARKDRREIPGCYALPPVRGDQNRENGLGVGWSCSQSVSAGSPAGRETSFPSAAAASTRAAALKCR